MTDDQFSVHRLIGCIAVLLALAAYPDTHRLSAQEPTFSAERIMGHVRYLAGEPLQGRRAGTPFEQRAADYVATQLDKAQVNPLPEGMRVQRFPFTGRPNAPQSLNVLGWIAADQIDKQEGVLVLGAHIDHLGQTGNGGYFPGADDNASGVAVVLEVAAALQRVRVRLRRPVCVVFFGAEEVGMIGSYRFVQQGPIEQDDIVAMVNVDMIGRKLVDQQQLAWAKKLLRVDSSNSIGVVGTLGRKVFRDVVEQACERAKLSLYGHQAVLSPIVQNIARNRGDHSPFENVGIPTLFFGSGESDDYHKPSDTSDKLQPKLMARRAQVVYDCVLALATIPREELPAHKPPQEAAPKKQAVPVLVR